MAFEVSGRYRKGPNEITPEDFHRRSREVAVEIHRDYPAAGFVCLPMETGGAYVGAEFFDYLGEMAPVRTHPVRRDRERMRITSPSVNDVRKSSVSMRKDAGEIVGIGYDDIFASGTDAVILYRWLERHGSEMEMDSYLLAAAFDMRGLADYVSFDFSPVKMDMREYSERIGINAPRKSRLLTIVKSIFPSGTRKPRDQTRPPQRSVYERLIGGR